ncbi:nitric oxide synthase oxygenase [Cryptosporangium sp. NPDC048952]|uniref:nitric oxide synthase oxygenase n=1 Tax=Cryptosporangium sp. NPDC048952 TaxID=3363961 RepID=UPI003721DC25
MTADVRTGCPIPARTRQGSWWQQLLPESWRPLTQLIDVLTACYTDDTTPRDGLALRARVRTATAEASTNPARRWTPTLDELRWAAHRAWRDEPRCIGRWRWNALTVRDRRQLTDPDDLAIDLVAHLREATRDGQIKPVVTVLHPDVEIRNEQLIGYAGYRLPGGGILGDPRHTEVTSRALDAGWSGGHRPTLADWERRTQFDVLPLLFTAPGSAPGQPPVLRELPASAVRQVELHHPDHPGLATLGLRWYTVPALTSHDLVLTDTVAYPVVISGHYLSTEIACRDLADTDRYDLLPAVAELLALDTSSPRSDWHAHAQLVLHQAVLHSFDAAGVRISDPITEAGHYQRWVQREHEAGRVVREDWSWIVPPHAPASTAVFHRYLPLPVVPTLPAYRARTDP